MGPVAPPFDRPAEGGCRHPPLRRGERALSDTGLGRPTSEIGCESADALRGRRVVVLGDVMLDTWIDGHVERISPEAPIPVLRIDRRPEMLGGAGNVARNIAALGGTAILVGVVGEDEPGRRIAVLL